MGTVWLMIGSAIATATLIWLILLISNGHLPRPRRKKRGDRE
jgi:hypothetical protein